MASLRRLVARGDTPLLRFVRRAYLAVLWFSIPIPHLLARPIARIYDVGRFVVDWMRRALIAEPLFKARCTRYGRDVHTGIFVHWMYGEGELTVGDGSRVDGRSSFSFASRFSDRPRLAIGRRTYVGHACSFAVARSITIGDDVYIAAGCSFLDSPGHPLDPTRRLAKLPPDEDQVRPVVVGDNVWIGTDVMIMPGVTVGEGSVVAARSVVTKDVPPYSLVAGVPARVVRALDPVRRPGEPSPSDAGVLAGSGAAD
jgi:acetyltransferase-like isoleucine patch superfamily enzyme